MRRILCFFLAITMIACIPINTLAASSAKMVLKITDVCKDKNSVGSDWKRTYTINDEVVKSNSSVQLSAGDILKLTAEIIELDDDYDDVGEESATYTVTQDDIDNGFKIEITLTIEENAGRYKGRLQKHTVTFSFTPSKK